MTFLLAAFALVSLGSVLWQWASAVRFPLHRRVTMPPPLPAVTILKPLKGCDVETAGCLRSWLELEYPADVQVLFGVASPEDPAAAVVRDLLRQAPTLDAELVLCPATLGANAKVSKLAQLLKRAKHDVILISDADVLVPADLLVNLVATLDGKSDRDEVHQVPTPPRDVGNAAEGGPARREGGVGLAFCLYQLGNPVTLAMRWEAVAVNTDFWSQVLQGVTVRAQNLALGATMVTWREEIEGIGGFEAIADCLADDYQLGNRIARRGRRIAVCPVVVECRDAPMRFREVWRHQLRWARTIRVSMPKAYFFSILGNGTLWLLALLAWVWLAGDSMPMRAGPALPIFVAACLLTRIATALDLQRRLCRQMGHVPFFWLVPVKDVLQCALWLGAFAGHHIEWRGERFRLRPDGRLVRTDKTMPAG